MTPEEIAKQFHDTYERLAPTFGYQTRQDTRSFDPESPNGRLMIAVCGEVLTALREKLAAAEASLAERGRMLETTHRVQRSYRAAVAAALAELRQGIECIQERAQRMSGSADGSRPLKSATHACAWIAQSTPALINQINTTIAKLDLQEQSK